MGTDRYGNKYFENTEELPRKSDLTKDNNIQE